MSCGNKRVNCIMYKQKGKSLEVEDKGAETLSIEFESMEINAYDANPNMEIPILSLEQMHHIENNLQRRVTESAMRVKGMRKSNEIESR